MNDDQDQAQATTDASSDDLDVLVIGQRVVERDAKLLRLLAE